MVLIHILCNSSDGAQKVTNFLHEEKLVYHSTIDTNPSECYIDNEQTQKILLTVTTKALLFQEIEQKTKKKFPKAIAMMYALPIIYMDEEHSEKLKNTTLKI